VTVDVIRTFYVCHISKIGEKYW